VTFTDFPAFLARGLLFDFLALPFLPGILYYDAIEIFIELIGVHVREEKLVRLVEDEPGERLALLPVQEYELLEDGGEFFFCSGACSSGSGREFSGHCVVTLHQYYDA
jgi:hypothetical protein